ncbi:hypothetical protein DSO57_1017776 [Entomophthora muscae]|uniref:Uncharacterized protein n=1 Tax=Entomophthora muscae TaxID=34485 RepID=A0ACC2S6M7_9FUNG|nr:hypothetical protein DSO57_1017776 [Entomophthora muscae]
MTMPLTLRPNHPMGPPTAAETTPTQLFGVLYITLTGMHPSYGGHYPLAWKYPVQSHLMPPPMPGFLTIRLKKCMADYKKATSTFKKLLKLVNCVCQAY